jgi:cyanuric acid amidohydrolase
MSAQQPEGRVQQVGVFRVACQGPADLSGVQALVDQGRLKPQEIVAVMGKTEGNGCVNDHTRDYASMAWSQWLAAHLGCSPAEAAQNVALVMSGGTEGVLSPHFTVFTRQWLTQASQPRRDAPPRLVIGTAHTRALAPQELGRMAQIEATAQAVRQAMAQAGIERLSDVHFVQVKCPLLTSSDVQSALADGHETVTRDTYESMGYSRGASALGVALALDEVPEQALSDAAVLRDWSLYSSCASVSAGIEVDHNVVIVLGEAAGAASTYRIAHTVMHDAIDGASVRTMLDECFATEPEHPAGGASSMAPSQPSGRLVNLLAKAESSPNGLVRGMRHTMLNDSDINATRHARAAVGGVLAAIAGHTALYVSGGAEHQGPAGGGPVAAILLTENAT